MKRCYLLITSIALLFAQAALAQTFSVKGVLRDPLGRTVADGAYKLTLRLYTQAEGGTEVWSEVHGSVQAENGVVSLELGTITPLSGVGFSQTYWLGITVGNFPEMEPRIKLGTNPYSLAVKGEDNLFPSTGNVGINTLAPTQPLEVNGNAKVTGALMFGDGSSMSSADLGGTASSLANPSTALITADSDQDGSGEIQFLTGTSTDLVIKNDGNVGIGTAAPTSNLSVSGNANVTGRLGINLPTPDTDANLSIGGIGSVIELGAGVPDKQGDAGKIMYRGYGDALEIVGGGANSARRIKFYAEHGAEFTGSLRVGGGSAPSGAALSVGDGVSYFDSPGIVGGAMTIDGTNGRVGIGTATPNSRLSFGTSLNNRLFGLYDDPNSWYGFGSAPFLMRLQVPSSARFGFFSGDATEVMTIQGNGRVGIGTATPTNNLSVSGDANVTGNLGTGGLRVGAGGLPAGAALSVGPSTTYFDKPNVVGGAMTIDGTNGRVGIGTSAPPEGLHVFTGKTLAATGAGVNIAGGNGGNAAIELVTNGGNPHIDFSNGTTDDYDARFILVGDDNLNLDGAKLAAEVINPSDVRIKNVLGVSDGARDLETLKGLEVVDYTHIDTVNMGKGMQKKLLAQQVQQVYPRAVTQMVNFVPSVYQMSASIAHHAESGLLTISTGKEHGFAAGDTVRLYLGKAVVEKSVQQVVDMHTFAVEHPEAVEQVFVYGKKVHDFLAVDYDAVAMLNVSATQELARRVEKLEREKAILRAELSRYQALEAENALLKVRMERFEAVLQRLEAQQADPQRAESVVVEGSGLSMAE